jgi:hypothetical protein
MAQFMACLMFLVLKTGMGESSQSGKVMWEYIPFMLCLVVSE